RRAYERELRIANYEKDRAALQPGEPCPLCLSTHHPFREQTLEPMVDEVRLRLQRAEKHCERLAQRRNTLRLEHQSLLTRLAGLIGHNGDGNGRLPRLEAEIEALEAEWQRHWKTLPPELRLPLLDGEPLECIARYDDELQTRRQTLTELRKVEEALQDTEGKIQTLQREIAELRGKLTGHQANLEQSRERCKALEKDLAERASQLRAEGENLGVPPEGEDFDRWINALWELKTVYETHLQEKESCEEQLKVLAAERKNLRERAAELEERLKRYRTEVEKHSKALKELQLEREALLGKEDPAAAKKRLQEALQNREQELEAARNDFEATRLKERETASAVRVGGQELEKLRAEESKVREALLQELPALGFSDLGELEGALLSDEAAEGIETRLQKWQDAWNHQSKMQERIAKELKKLEENPPWEADRDPESLESELAALNERREALLKEIGGLQADLQRNEERRKEAAALEKAWNDQKKTLERWERLNDLIGSADGKKFRTYAQGLTLRK
ncbi:MAG: hypothetical protein D6765_09235, partial [Bacteroidetes bacterium]